MVLLKRKFWIFSQFICALIVILLIVNLLYDSTSTLQLPITPLELKDWENYELIREDSLRTGFGEHGKGEQLTDANEIEENKKLFAEYGISALISDKISVNRSIPEYRHQKCYQMRYPKDLPKVSIIIIFVDEYFSIFKRTLHSLYNRTPHELIEEVILVNDHSTKDFLYEPLRIYVEENFPGIKFNIINLKKRHGLMQARVVGAKAAKSEFLFITEPHCEMTYNWLPPLIVPLINEKKVVTVPIIDNIEWKEFLYFENDKGNKGCRGAFDWDLEYKKLNRYPVPEESELEPFLTPVMTGGIFMIRKAYFFEIGPYDPELIIWGAENIEMSLKINLCGGQLLEVPCSHIGHIYRAFTKARRHESGMDFEGFNRKRVVEVWFDDYKQHVYERHKRRYDSIDVGDLTEAKKFRQKLKCKSFDYFLKNVAPDILVNFPLDQYPFAYGQIQLQDEDICLETMFEGDPSKNYDVILTECTKPSIETQYFELSWYRDIRLREMDACLDAYKISASACHQSGGNQHFKYIMQSKQIMNMANKQCIEVNFEDLTLKFAKCDESLKQQKWIFNEFVNQTALSNWSHFGRPLQEDGVYWD
ncbi:N-acetylgalactosaminyltransferase 6-like [Chironomus tepperi]|uniref:N-acetylgalactosaminyltransferase 6-like n=1 Tax=Chironomus tepperi TaxID=113505 RepID=UPI00391F61A9